MSAPKPNPFRPTGNPNGRYACSFCGYRSHSNSSFATCENCHAFICLKCNTNGHCPNCMTEADIAEDAQ